MQMINRYTKREYGDMLDTDTAGVDELNRLIVSADSEEKSEKTDRVSGKPLDDKRRAGYTTNKGNGVSKTRRKMAKESRRRNRA